VITETLPDVAGLADAAASAVARTLAVGEPLSIGSVTELQVQPELPAAVLVPLGGVVDGELAVFVDETIATALSQSAIGELDLAAALAPTLDELGRTLGSVLIGVPQTLDARMAHGRLASRSQAASVALPGATAIRAAVAVALDPAPAAAPTTSGVRSQGGAYASERLDLLRGVEMAATVELGRARMTINDLLSLRDGAIIELDRAAGEAADLLVNGRLIARGEIVVVDENYALRITQIVSDEAGV
jgi:flagellar motor switch protein FliN